MYLVTNVMKNRGAWNFEFRNIDLDKIFIKSNVNEHELEIGEFVIIEKVSGKNNIKEKVETPENYIDYYPHGDLTYNELYTEFENYYNKITNKKFKLILDETIFKNLEYFKYPAAKSIHHAFIGGLAEHTINILKLSHEFISLYKLDQELLWMGIILHDYSKIHEMTKLGLNYTPVGNLIGHLVMTVEEISKICFKYEIDESDEIIYLKHLILSHHGKLEYGSPKEPMLREAYILSQLDEVDAKMNVIDKAYLDTKSNSLTPPILAFDRRRFLKPKDD